MIQFRYFLLLILIGSFYNASAQNDCSDALVVCGNTGFEGLSATGVGIQELSGSNTCGSQENNSIWLKISIDQGGTLGFTLTPQSTSLLVDFDFFIFGPNVTCGNIGQAIRCSTTNPEAAGSSSNTTGLNATETDTAEGPGPTGNNFLKWLTVSDGDSYFLVIDRPQGSSNFSLTWTGTATFTEPPVFDIPTGAGIDIEECDIDATDDEKTVFNLAQNTPITIGSQTNVAVTYHLNSNDAIVGENAIANPANFTNSQNPQTIYTRITDTNSGCFNTTDFEIRVINSINIPNSAYGICDDNSDGNSTNGFATFNLDQANDVILEGEDISNLTIKYYANNQDAVDGVSPLPSNFTNTTANQQIVFIKVVNPDNCFKIKEVTLIVNPLPVIVNTTLVQCDSGFNPDGLTTFNLNEALSELTNNDTNFEVKFRFNGTEINPIYNNISNPQIIQAVVTNLSTGCSSSSTVNLNVNLVNPIVTIPAVCDDEASEDGFASFDLSNADLILTPNQTVRYFETVNDALLEQNTITNTANYTNLTPYDATIYFRIEEQNSCSGIGSLALKVNRLPTILKTLEKDYYVCENLPIKYISLDPRLLEGNPADFTYEWFKDNQILPETTYSIQVNEPGNYSVTVTNTQGCSKTRLIPVLNSSDAIIDDIIITDLTPYQNSIEVILNPASIGNYVFALDYEDAIYQSSGFFDNVSMGFHTIYINDLNGCGMVQKLIAIVGAPRYFTPNGDGYNDSWKIEGISQYFSPSTVTYLYDRYGKFIHKIFALDDGWDGTLNGTPLPADDYWYVINLEDGRTVKGHFSLKR
ncbi:T9SS type B sorting domain-containing protein [Flavobacterium antarcticum]|uniref:T9SS type B sorting domain-containing protein n=1 Tax=Flavobacterium antarcticum TaxID=271155 RepID=UPI0003B5240F|nr:T9SS type B sorting domain-containing protein [Flavobacterium antarcticum]